MINVNEPLLDGNEKKYLNECIETGWISSEGPFIAAFEEKFSHKVSRGFGVAVANGTAALEIAVKALGIGPGDEVILPTFTIISPAAAISNLGAVPILVDCEPDTWNMKVGDIEARITSRTKAIMVVHIYGHPTDMDPVLALAKKYSLKVIEDAAEMHGQTYKGRMCGSFGDISTFSFYPNKHVTTGEGGMIVTDDAELAAKCKYYRNLCFEPHRRFVHEEIGWNYRMTNLQAALGLAQLERLDEFVVRKREMGKLYNELLSDVYGLDLPLVNTLYSDSIYWVYALVIKPELDCDATDVMKKLGQEGIGTRPFFWPMHEQPVYLKQGLFRDEKHPVAEYIARKGFYIPSGLGLKEDQIRQVAAILIKVMNSYK